MPEVGFETVLEEGKVPDGGVACGFGRYSQVGELGAVGVELEQALDGRGGAELVIGDADGQCGGG